MGLSDYFSLWLLITTIEMVAGHEHLGVGGSRRFDYRN